MFVSIHRHGVIRVVLNHSDMSARTVFVCIKLFCEITDHLTWFRCYSGQVAAKYPYIVICYPIVILFQYYEFDVKDVIKHLTLHQREGLARLEKIIESVPSMKLFFAIAAILVAGVVGYVMWPTMQHPTTTDAAISFEDDLLADVLLPKTLSPNAQIGQRAFEAKCASCHGVNAAGQDSVAPPLIHIIYEPSHHNDEAFYRAVAMGVRGHHWPFGDMPPVEGVTRAEVTMIVTYIRELQRANGIE